MSVESFGPCTDLKVEMTHDGPLIYELESEPAPGPSARPGLARAQAPAEEALEPDVASVVKALLKLAGLTGSKATLESCRIFRVFSLKKFRANLGDVSQSEADAFAEALEASAMHFTQKQQDQITAWTGLSINTAPLEATAADEMDDGEEELERKLRELKETVDGKPAKGGGRGPGRVKQEAGVAPGHERYHDSLAFDYHEPAPEQVMTSGRRPDLKGRPAPNTPAAAAARHWADARRQPPFPQNRQWAGSTGSQRRPYRPPGRSMGIVSLDESARLHGEDSKPFHWAQHSNRFIEHHAGQLLPAKEEVGGEKRPSSSVAPSSIALKRPKGTPTIAPMCPAPGEVDI